MAAEVIGAAIGLAGILIGVLTSYYFYARAIRIKAPTWAAHSFNLIRDFASELRDIRVLFRDQPVSNLTVTRIMFWNDGRATIDGSDIVRASPLRIAAAPGVRLLAAEIVASNRPSTAVTINLNDRADAAIITFDYLDHNNGAIFQVIHDGVSTSDIKVVGEVKGANVLAHKAESPYWTMPARVARPALRFLRSRVFMIAGLLLYFVTGTYFLLVPYRPSPPETPSPFARSLFGALLIMLGLFMTAVTVASRRAPVTPPPGLEGFYDWPRQRLPAIPKEEPPHA